MNALACALILFAAHAVPTTTAVPKPAPEEIVEVATDAIVEPASETTAITTPVARPVPVHPPRPRPTPFPKYETTLPVTTPDAEVIHDLVLHEILNEYFYGPWPQGTMWIVSDTGHWDALLEKKGPASEARAAVLAGKDLPHDALAAALEKMLAKKNESIADPGTFEGPFTRKLVASADTLGPMVMKPNPKKSENKPVWASLSAIGYSEDRAVAVECGSSWIGSFVGGGDCFLLRKTRDGWTVVERHVIYRQ